MQTRPSLRQGDTALRYLRHVERKEKRTPETAVPVAGSIRMSLRSSCLSTKYGPTVNSGWAIHPGSAVPLAAAVDALAPAEPGTPDVSRLHPMRSAPPPTAIRRTASRRLRTRPTGRSSLSILLLPLRYWSGIQVTPTQPEGTPGLCVAATRPPPACVNDESVVHVGPHFRPYSGFRRR